MLTTNQPTSCTRSWFDVAPLWLHCACQERCKTSEQRAEEANAVAKHRADESNRLAEQTKRMRCALEQVRRFCTKASFQVADQGTAARTDCCLCLERHERQGYLP